MAQPRDPDSRHTRRAYKSERLPSAPPVLEARAEDLLATFVTATLDVPVQSSTNLLWCGTFQLAWNEATEFFGEDLQFIEKVPLAAALNRKEFTKAEIDEGSYITMGGILTDDLASQIRSESRSKFGRGFKPQLVPNPSGDPELFFYASLSKNLAFEEQFQVSDHPMRFTTNEVVAFGIERSHLANGDYVDTDPLWRQVRL